MLKPMEFRFVVPPGNSEFVIPWDSTRGPTQISQASIPAGSVLLAPGGWRGMYPRAVVSYSILVTGQNVTVDEQILTGNAGTSADWETQGALGTFTATAGTTAVREFKPVPGAEHRLLITAGATGPTTLVLWGSLVVGTHDFGS